MELKENKFGLGFAIFLAIALTFFFKAFSRFSEGRAEKDRDNLSYEMPRPKEELIGEFGLGDREIDRRYLNPFEKQKAAQAAAAKAAQAAQAKKTAAARKPMADKAKEAADKAKQHNVRVVERAEDRLHDTNNANKVRANDENATGDVVAESPRSGSANGGDVTKEEGRSPDQWRALMSADPSKANMLELVKAFQKGEVDEATFYSIVQDLMKSQSEEKQSIGAYGLSQVYSVKAFALAGHYAKETTTSPKTITALQIYMNTYATASRRSVLLQALQSGDQDVALAAAGVVQVALTTNPRDGGVPRGEVQTASLEQWGSFRSVFQRWAQSGDAALQGPANTILALLPTTNA